MQAELRKPLSPVKANGQHQRVAHSKENINRKQQGAQEEDVFAQSTTKPKKQSDKIPAFYVSKIPRATPSPDAATSRHLVASGSKIPKPVITAAPANSQRPGSADLLSGFQSYSNPSFVDTTHNLTGHHAGLATPEAVQILQQAGNNTGNEENDAKNKGMGAIMNAYLRTGPQKLSPEPSKDYCIVAPKPAAVPPGGSVPKYMSAASGVPMTAEEYLRSGAQYLPSESGMGNNNNNHAAKVPDPQPKHPTAQIPPTVEEEEEREEQQMEQQPVSPEPAPTPEGKNTNDFNDESLQGTTPASVCSNIPDIFDDLLNGGSGTPASEVKAAPERRIVGTGIKIRLLPAVDSQQTTMADSQATTADVPGTHSTNHHQHHGRGAVPASPTFMPTPEEEIDKVPDRREVQSKRPSPVAFALPSSSSDGDEKEQQSGGGGASGDCPAGWFSFNVSPFFLYFLTIIMMYFTKTLFSFHLCTASSGGSFSFGFGAGARAAAAVEVDPGGPTPEACIAPPPEPLHRKCSGSGDSVDQPNLFVSMLDHFKADGPGAYASPHRPRDEPGAFGVPVAPWLQAGFASPRPGGGAGGGFGTSPVAAAAADAGLSEGSPQSPLNCTPMHLLSEGAAAAPSSAAAAQTPELGKGDLVAWIDRRGMRDMLSSPAAADLRRMWNAMRESAASRAAAAAAVAENEALRIELQEARAALERLGAEHSEALTAAQAGQQWAEAEVVRAREAAQHMMALADQIQSTFALCEKEKATLAEELEQAWTKAEQEAQAAAIQAAASDQEHAKAAELNRELQLAQAAAQRAATEAAQAQALARASAAELAAIKKQLFETHEAMSIQQAPTDSDSDNGEGVPSTPFSKLRAQLHSAHEALAALHASGSKYHITTCPTSPHIDRLYESSAHGLSRAQELLQQDTSNLHQANDELRALLSGVQARIMQLSPAASEDEEEESKQNTASINDTARESSQQQPSQVVPAEVGTVTVDFRELRSVLAQTGQPVPSSPYISPNVAAGNSSCNIEIDGVMVTNIPPNALSQVRSMVDYFEELAGVQGIPLTPQNLTPNEVEDSVSIMEEEQQGEQVWTPVPATAERLRAFLPPRAGVTPAASARPTPTNGRNSSGLPPAPAASPVNELTPGLQRLHLQGLDALAALQYHDNPMAEPEVDEEEVVTEEEKFPIDQAGPAFSAGVPPTPEVEAEHSEEELASSPTFFLPLAPEDSECCSESEATAADAAFLSPALSREVTPVDMVAIQQGGAAGLRDEVRARLHRLKTELQAARSKLSHVDRGLAAIATPNRGGNTSGVNLELSAPATRLALQGPVSLPSPFVQQQHQPQLPVVPLTTAASAPAAIPTAMHITPAIAGATPRTRLANRPSVRFADSVKFNCEDDQPRKRLPRTPGISSSTSTVAYRAVASPQPMVASTIRIADPIVLTPSSAFAMMANRGGSSSASAARRRPNSAGTVYSVAVSAAAPCRQAEEELNPSRKLDLGSYDDSSSDDDDFAAAAPNTQDSARSRMAMQYNGHIHSGAGSFNHGGGMTPASRTPMAHPEFSKYYGAGGDILPHNATPLSRFSSASSFVAGAATAIGSTSMPSPDPAAALLSIRPAVGRVWRGHHNHHPGATASGARRVSDSEEREFRRRAAALKIHVSPYFKRTGAAARSHRDLIDVDATVL